MNCSTFAIACCVCSRISQDKDVVDSSTELQLIEKLLTETILIEQELTSTLRRVKDLQKRIQIIELKNQIRDAKTRRRKTTLSAKG